jgi:hypothetical protein
MFISSTFLVTLLSALLGVTLQVCTPDMCPNSSASDLAVFIDGQNRNEVTVEIQHGTGSEMIQVEGGQLVAPTWQLVSPGTYRTTFQPVGLKHWRVDGAKLCGTSHKWWSADQSNCWFAAKPPHTVIAGGDRNKIPVRLTGATGKEQIQVQGGSLITPTWQLLSQAEGIYQTNFDAFGHAFWTVDGGGTCATMNTWWEPDASSCWFSSKPAAMQVEGSARNLITVILTGGSGLEKFQIEGGTMQTSDWQIVDRASGKLQTTYKPVGIRWWTVAGVTQCVTQHPLWKIGEKCWLGATKATVSIAGQIATAVNITITNASSKEMIQLAGGALITPTWSLIDMDNGTYTATFNPRADLPAWTVLDVATCASSNVHWLADQSNCWFNRIWQPFGIYLPMVAR